RAVVATLCEPVDEIDDVLAPASGPGSNAASGNGDGKMGLASAGPADQHDVALLSEEAPTCQVVDQRLIDRSAVELEVVEVLCTRQLGDGELVLDRARLLLADLGLEEVTDDALGLMLTLDGGGHDLLEGVLHAVELELAHEIEEFSAFH